MDDLLFKITETQTQGAIRWQKRALEAEAELAAEGGKTLVEMTTDRNQFRARVAELEARKESANMNILAVSEYMDRLESLVGSAAVLIGRMREVDAIEWMDRHYMRRRINIADQDGKGGDDA